MEQEADYHFKVAALWHSLSDAIKHDKVEQLSTLITTPALRDGVFTFEEPLYPGSPFFAGHAMTPVRAAVRVNAIGCLRWLLAQGADPNDRRGHTAGRGHYEYGLIASAVASGFDRLVDVLLATPGLNRRLTPLDWFYILPSITSYSVGMVNHLIRHGIRPDGTTLPDPLQSVFRVSDTRIARCRAVCQILLRRLTRIRQRDLRTDLVRRFVWSTRYEPVWTPDMAMPPDFD